MINFDRITGHFSSIMSNLTLACLVTALRGQESLISVAHARNQNEYHFTKLSVTRSFTHFMFSQTALRSLTFGYSSFTKFLDSPISVDAQFIKENEQFSTTMTAVDDSEIVIRNCQFNECISDKPGAAIHIDSSECDLSVLNCIFNVCRCKGKGGAIYAKMKQMVMTNDCFQLCRCGKENGNDGSTIYAFSKTGINTSYVSALRCPEYGDQCWYGIIILCNGVLDSQNINISNSDVEYIAGLAHFRPDYDKSFLKYYTSVNEINGNALAFIDFTFRGHHEFGSLVNDTSKSGIFYVQNTTTTLQNYVFVRNRGPITYSCVGNSKANFENCVFSQRAGNYGIGWGEAINCTFDVPHAQTHAMKHLNTAYCEVPKQQEPMADVVHANRVSENHRPLTVISIFVAIVTICSILIFYKRIYRRMRIHRNKAVL